MLVQIPGILGRDDVAALRKALKPEDYVDGRLTAGGSARDVKTNLELHRKSATQAELARLVGAALARNGVFGAAAAPKAMVTPLFNLYRPGMHYGDHVDNALMTGSDGARIRVDLSFTLFLSEPDEYDGGELVIKTGYGRHPIKLPAGQLALYPTYFVHEVTPVTRGDRWACVGWIQSLVRDPTQREILFDLALLGQSLAAGGARQGDIDLLDKARKNLLRQWAEA